MEIVDVLVIALIVAIVGFAAWYIVRSKKKGRNCIGCPDGATCSGNCAGCSSMGKKQ